jgi:hypothetical protein
VLAKMGFQSYEAYLLSPLWAAIRQRKWEEDGKVCWGCGEPADSVHHADYSLGVLKGEALHRLFSVCEACHKMCEFFLGVKLGPGEATRLLQQKRKERNL